MKRIAITSTIEKLANKFKKEMLYVKPIHHEISRACTQLAILCDNFDHGWIAMEVKNSNGEIIYPARSSEDLKNYITKIKTEYENLLILHPSNFSEKISEFNRIIPTEEICKIKIKRNPNGDKEEWLHELIVKKMRYNYVQSKIFPKYIRLMGIKTCVYCNSQYAITTRSDESLYQLDHCMPKSRYPYLSTSFFNLQPCCSSCNLWKSDNDILYGNYSPSIWRELDEPDEDYFLFKIKEDALTQYLLTRDKDDIAIELVIKGNALDELVSLHNDYQKYFKIDALYSEHKDVVEEILWKQYVYSNSYIKSLRSAFKSINKVNLDFSRFIMGNYMNKDDVFKRPLSKLVQDIASQLHISLEQSE